MKFSDLIKRLQAEMNRHGEKLAEDGDPGPKTQAALEGFDVEIRVVKKNSQSIGDRLGPALSIIKEFEGLYLEAYRDPVGIPTIGWGTIKYPNGQKVQMGDRISIEQAEEYLLYEVRLFATQVTSLVTRQITNNAFCALVSFCYNLGAGSLKKSTLLRRLNGGEPMEAVATEFMKWVNAGGKPLKGLIRRREAEKALFLA